MIQGTISSAVLDLTVSEQGCSHRKRAGCSVPPVSDVSGMVMNLCHQGCNQPCRTTVSLPVRMDKPVLFFNGVREIHGLNLVQPSQKIFTLPTTLLVQAHFRFFPLINFGFMAISAFPEAIRFGYEIHEWRHASAILASDFPDELADICDVLERFHHCKTFLTTPGGRKSKVSEWIDSQLYRKEWNKKSLIQLLLLTGTLLKVQRIRWIVTRTGWRWKLSGTTRTRFLIVI